MEWLVPRKFSAYWTPVGSIGRPRLLAKRTCNAVPCIWEQSLLSVETEMPARQCFSVRETGVTRGAPFSVRWKTCCKITSESTRRMGFVLSALIKNQLRWSGMAV